MLYPIGMRSDYNFGALSGPVSHARLFFELRQSTLYLAGFVLAAVVTLWGLLVLAMMVIANLSFIELLVAFGISLSSAGIGYALLRSQTKTAMLRQFAVDNRLEFFNGDATNQHHATCFTSGMDSNSITGIKARDSHTVEFGISHGVSQRAHGRSIFDYTYARFELSQHLPDMLLDNKRNRQSRFRLGSPWSPMTFKPLYASTKYDIRALAIHVDERYQAQADAILIDSGLTAAMQSATQPVSYETHGKELVFYALYDGQITDAKLREFLEIVNRLFALVDSRLGPNSLTEQDYDSSQPSKVSSGTFYHVMRGVGIAIVVALMIFAALIWWVALYPQK